MTAPTKPTAFERFSRTHHTHCKVNLFSLQKERVCTCGRDAAIREVEVYKAACVLVRTHSFEEKKRAEIVQLQMMVEPQ